MFKSPACLWSWYMSCTTSLEIRKTLTMVVHFLCGDSWTYTCSDHDNSNFYRSFGQFSFLCGMWNSVDSHIFVVLCFLCMSIIIFRLIVGAIHCWIVQDSGIIERNETKKWYEFSCIFLNALTSDSKWFLFVKMLRIDM